MKILVVVADDIDRDRSQHCRNYLLTTFVKAEENMADMADMASSEVENVAGAVPN